MGDFANSIANDYKIATAQGQETVTFTAKRTDGNTSYTITNADGGDVTAQEILASGGYFQYGDWSFLLGNNQIPIATDKPQAGDTITQLDGTVWEILSAVIDSLGVSWNCVVRKAR